MSECKHHKISCAWQAQWQGSYSIYSKKQYKQLGKKWPMSFFLTTTISSTPYRSWSGFLCLLHRSKILLHWFVMCNHSMLFVVKTYFQDKHTVLQQWLSLKLDLRVQRASIHLTVWVWSDAWPVSLFVLILF